MKVMFAASALLLAACGQADRQAEPSPGNFVPPVTQAPAPISGQRQVTPLTAYVGHYPSDAVDGVSFFDRTEVSGLLIDDVPEEKLRRAIVGREATTVPIFALGQKVAAHGCEAHNCADRNWTVVVSPDGNRDQGTVCWHDADAMGDHSRWTTRAGTEMRAGDCPQA